MSFSGIAYVPAIFVITARSTLMQTPLTFEKNRVHSALSEICCNASDEVVVANDSLRCRIDAAGWQLRFAALSKRSQKDRRAPSSTLDRNVCRPKICKDGAGLIIAALWAKRKCSALDSHVMRHSGHAVRALGYQLESKAVHKSGRK